MIVLGLLLLAAGAGLGVDVAIENRWPIDVAAFGRAFTLDAGWLFVTGAVAGAVAMLGLWMVVAGAARSHRRRAAMAATRDNAEAERDRLAKELERERTRPNVVGVRRGLLGRRATS